MAKMLVFFDENGNEFFLGKDRAHKAQEIFDDHLHGTETRLEDGRLLQLKWVETN